MNSRRLMGLALGPRAVAYHIFWASALIVHHSKVDRRMTEMGQKR
jgi:hypothetical protein